MKCLRCGYCCIQYEVIIVKNPDKKPSYRNLDSKHTGVRCPHLLGEEPGKFSCSLHDKAWYEDTPCARHTQFEVRETPCRIGSRMMTYPQEQRDRIIFAPPPF